MARQYAANDANDTNPDDFSLVSSFKGFISREDPTNAQPGLMVRPSQNVLTNATGRVGIRHGFTLDGQNNITLAGIKSAPEFVTSRGKQRTLRAGNTKLQFRYVATAGDKYNGTTFTAGQVYWIDLVTGLTVAQTKYRYVDFYDTTQRINVLLLANGKVKQIDEWSGAIATVASATVSTITKTGTSTWAQEGFYAAPLVPRTVVIDNVTYTYTGGETTTTLTGVTPSPAAVPVQSVVWQGLRAHTSFLGIADPNYTVDNISQLNNQVFIATSTSNDVYMSKTNSVIDYTFSSPRTPGEGAQFILRGSNAFFAPQEDTMYFSVGRDFWYELKTTLSSDNTAEDIKVRPLKTSAQQGARDQFAIFKIKNSVMFINHEPTLDELGRIVNNFSVPQALPISDPVRDDFNQYDFTDASGLYFKNFMYICVPVEQKVLVYNIAFRYWEAPQTFPVGLLSIIDGELYGHDYYVPRSYKLFDGNSDLGNPIDAQMYLSYQNFGTRSVTKAFNELYVEGYINDNTDLQAGITYDVGGCTQQVDFEISGDNSTIVCKLLEDASLGKSSLGKNPFGSGILPYTGFPDGLAKFRGVLTSTKNDFYEVQFSFRTYQAAAQWEILAVGPKVARTGFRNNAIKSSK
jgi:hypothetical protein